MFLKGHIVSIFIVFIMCDSAELPRLLVHILTVPWLHIRINLSTNYPTQEKGSTNASNSPGCLGARW